VGTSGLPFTNTRVYPDTTVAAWPNRLAGKLFFHDPAKNTDFVCSASIIARRLVLTAGHCVYNTVANVAETNFAFVPAYNGTLVTQPFGTWQSSFSITTSAWVASDGLTFPNVSDFGILVMKDQNITGGTRKIGEYLGWLGSWTFSLIRNNVTAIGYPGNLDSGQRMQATMSQVVADGSLGGLIGSAMSGGASGGPWVQDFGIQAVGQVVSSSGSNMIVGVTSYGPSEGNTPRQLLGSSILNDDYVRIRNTACIITSGGC
jgi:V8-like Glu-specific endopeptidase